MIDLLWNAFDVLMIGLLWILGWTACSTRSPRRSITLFIALGLLLAIVWARLSAPDLALAEAAIGAGISGALLLAALGDGKHIDSKSVASTVLRLSIDFMSLCLFLVICTAFWISSKTPTDIEISRLVMEMLPQSGVTNPVTAVLLNFRAYDTLLELAVVLTAVFGILVLNEKRSVSTQPVGILLSGLTRWLVPLLILMSGYVLWIGAEAPGGAFQAGALLAAAMILLHLAQLPGQPLIQPHLIRMLLAVGLLVFILVGMVMLQFNGQFLDYNPASAGIFILLIETAATLSIAAALTLAYIGGRPSGWNPPTTYETSGEKI